jgi:hypothetical protein
MPKDKKKKELPSVYSFVGIVLSEENINDFNKAEGRDTRWYTNCFIVEVPCKGWICRLMKMCLDEKGKVFAREPGPMHLFFEPYDIPNAEGWSAWIQTT